MQFGVDGYLDVARSEVSAQQRIDQIGQCYVASGPEVVGSDLLDPVGTEGERCVADDVGEGLALGVLPLESLRVVGVGHRLGEDGAVGGDDQPSLLARLAERGPGVAGVVAVGLGGDGLYPGHREQTAR